jgi:hypothetical protein
VRICHPDPNAVTRTARGRPRLRLRVVRDRRHARVRVIARCPSGCRLRTDLYAVRRGAHRFKRVARKRSHMTRKQRRFAFRMPRHARRVQVRVLAVGRDGGSTSRIRAVRMR